MKLTCDTEGMCSAHADGLPSGEKCPGMCDSPGCLAQGSIEVTDSLGLLIFPVGCSDSDTAHVCVQHFTVIVPLRSESENESTEEESDG